MIDPNVVVKNMEALDGYITELRIRNNALEQQLMFAAGVISTLPEWSGKHPQEALEWIKNHGKTN